MCAARTGFGSCARTGSKSERPVDAELTARGSYNSFVSRTDPDGNGRLVQEVNRT
jgi:hypothetical protein